jgi:hypothetical protein
MKANKLSLGIHKNGVRGRDGGFAAIPTPTSPLFMILVGGYWA